MLKITGALKLRSEVSIVNNAPNRRIVRVPGWGAPVVADFGEDTPLAKAYADLFAAAPDMLAALENIEANAAESVEWIRRVVRVALENVRGTTLGDVADSYKAIGERAAAQARAICAPPAAMTRDEFIKSEHRALLNFDARTYDPNTSVAIPDREYTCECGFKTADPGEIFDHATAHARGGEIC